MTAGRIVSLDIGVKMIGVAVADPLGIIATPLGAVRRGQAIADDIAALKDILKSYEIARFVVGWPLKSDGTESENLPVVKGFEKKLKAAFPGVPVEHENELLSTRVARERISHSPKGRTDKKSGRLDAAAAAVILESYLARHAVSAPGA
ncbi:MAG TPA: Holliday junction resolvase RuvX [bacterium]|nr:Holliday junction resolvase RuvX [bacterium]